MLEIPLNCARRIHARIVNEVGGMELRDLVDPTELLSVLPEPPSQPRTLPSSDTL